MAFKHLDQLTTETQALTSDKLLGIRGTGIGSELLFTIDGIPNKVMSVAGRIGNITLSASDVAGIVSDVNSVNGQTGVVVLSASDIPGVEISGTANTLLSAHNLARFSHANNENIYLGGAANNTWAPNMGDPDTAKGNIGIGRNALSGITEGFDNGAYGKNALNRLTIGYTNYAFGLNAGRNVGEGFSNLAFGRDAMGGAADAGDVTCSWNIAFGEEALLNAGINCSNNYVIGSQAMRELRNGYENCAYGDAALYGLTNGHNNVAIGYYSLADAVSANNNISIGAYSGYQENADNQLYIDSYESQRNARSLGLVWGTFAATKADQQLQINGHLRSSYLLGYTTGAGVSAVQTVSKSTSVSLSAATGVITTNSETLSGNSAVSFTVNNPRINNTDVMIINIASGATAGAYVIQADAISTGSARIAIRNMTSNNLSESLNINFAIISGAIS